MGSYSAYMIKERIIEDIINKLHYGLNNEITEAEWREIAHFLLGELRAEGFYLVSGAEAGK